MFFVNCSLRALSATFYIAVSLWVVASFAHMEIVPFYTSGVGVEVARAVIGVLFFIFLIVSFCTGSKHE